MILDLIVVGAILVGFFQGYRRGLIHSLFFLAAFFLGSIIALRFGYLVSMLLQNTLGTKSEYLPLISIAILFIGVFGLILFVAGRLRDVLRAASLNLFNRIAGGVLWAGVAVYLSSLGFWYFEKYHIVTDDMKAASVTYPIVGELSQHMTEGLGRALPFVLDTYYDLDEMMDDFEKKHVPDADSASIIE